MENNHSDHSHDHTSGNIKTAFWINIVFTVIEIAGGLYTNSIAVLSDAVHDLGDSVALLFAMFMEKLSRNQSDQMLTFGYKRFSILGAFVNSIILVSGSVYVLYTAVNRLFSVEPVDAGGMILMAVAGTLFNSIAVLRLRKDESMNARVVFMHLLEDVLGWVSILVVSIVMYFYDLPILDPILSIVIAVFILSRIVPNLLKVGRIFLQYKPDDHEIKTLKADIETMEGVFNIHDVHLWTLDGANHIFSCHLAVSNEMQFSEIVELRGKIKEYLKDKGIGHATIEAEPTEYSCHNCDPENAE